MNIALVLDRFDPRHGGLEYWTYQLAEWLAAKGHVPHIVAFDFCGDTQEIPVVRHKVPAPRSRNPFVRAWRIADYLGRMSVDIIHDTGSSWHCDILQPQGGSKRATFFHQLRNLQRSQSAREMLRASSWYRQFFFHLVERRQFKRAGHMVAVSNLVREDFQRLYKVSDERITVIHNGVDVRKFTPGSGRSDREAPLDAWKPDRANTFLISANNFRLKGVDNALVALRNLKAAEIMAHLVVIGRGPVDEFQRLARNLGIGDRILFCGPVGDPESYYTSCDVYLHPALYDACSLSVLEAMACGAPVITSRFNGSSELINDGEQGLIVKEPRDRTELTTAMKRLCDEGFRSLLRSRARERALKLDIEQNFSRVLDLYENTAARKAQIHA